MVVNVVSFPNHTWRKAQNYYTGDSFEFPEEIWNDTHLTDTKILQYYGIKEERKNREDEKEKEEQEQEEGQEEKENKKKCNKMDLK